MGKNTFAGIVEDVYVVGNFWKVIWQKLLKLKIHFGKVFKIKILISYKYTCKIYERCVCVCMCVKIHILGISLKQSS